jgi:NMD protein affecting ribosome stability and mRNA decay
MSGIKQGAVMLGSRDVLRLFAGLLLASSATVGGAFAQAPSGTRSPHGNLSIPCQNCHTSTGWKPIRGVPEFDHNQTKYALRGMHQTVSCTQCHVRPVFTNVGQRCQDCHADIHKRQLGANCEQCHTVRGWQVSVQDIQQHNNRFPLTGAHATVDCDACHKGGATSKFQTMPTQCYFCHSADFKTATTPNHVAAGFSTTCESCHSTDNWLNAKFDHASVGFPLNGGHAVPPRLCADCHLNNNYNLASTACVGCHLKDYQGATNPNHVSAQFSQSCEQCHNITSWSNASFNHNATAFPLTGLHTVPPRQCTDCHVNNNYNLSTTACVSCHLKDYQGTTNPNHVTSSFPQTCDQCHNTTSWANAAFNHNSTGFALTGLHTVPPRQCIDCHINNNYTLSSAACVTCHLKDYQGTTNPSHVTASFPQACDQCHNTSSWANATFNHSSTGFPLSGGHAVPPRLCTDCHVNNNYSLNSTLCYSCHQKDYTGTNNPAHAAAGFPTTCELCHDTVVWTDSTFNHNNTAFPLTGSHMVPPRVCTDCHVNSNYTTLPLTCIGCHQNDYNNTTNPGHAAQPQFFPTTCQTCHNTTAWTGATFNHTQYTQFSINHGNANGVCATCHINSNNYAIFQCTGCHGGNNANNFRHEQVNGYVYNSINCYQCHQSGGGGG